MPPALDTALIRERQLQLGITDTLLARAFGRAPTSLRRILEGTTFATLTLRHITVATDLLGLQPAELLTNDAKPAATTPEPAQPPAESTTPADVQILGAALATIGHQVRKDDLAAALRWTPTRLTEAISQLDRSAPTIGQQIRKGSGLIGLAAAPLPADTTRLVLASTGSRRAGLIRPETRVLIDIANNPRSTTRRESADRKLRTATLRNLGLVHDSPARLTDDGRLGLLMDDLPLVPNPRTSLASIAAHLPKVSSVDEERNDAGPAHPSET